jgi:6-pyruvoyltetrahydropterin/6-carboxytetrahydropterin synthase
MMTEIAVSATWEAAHRLPHVIGKCASLHGHSWKATAYVSASAVDSAGMVTDMTGLKAGLRGWIDTNLDHGSMLPAGDRLVPMLLGEGCKVFRFGARDRTGLPAGVDGLPGERYAADCLYPTVELIARTLWLVTDDLLFGRAGMLTDGRGPGRWAKVARVVVREKHDNAAACVDEPNPAEAGVASMFAVPAGPRLYA